MATWRGTRVSKRTLAEIKKWQTEQVDILRKRLYEEQSNLRTTVPEQIMTAQYNAGYMRAMADLFYAIRKTARMTGPEDAFHVMRSYGYDRFRTVQGDDGRIAFKESI